MADGIDGGTMKKSIVIRTLFLAISGGLLSKGKGTIATPFNMTI